MVVHSTTLAIQSASEVDTMWSSAMAGLCALLRQGFEQIGEPLYLLVRTRSTDKNAPPNSPDRPARTLHRST
jgi:hypothetical protein